MIQNEIKRLKLVPKTQTIEEDTIIISHDRASKEYIVEVINEEPPNNL